jgi:hypothetical protein
MVYVEFLRARRSLTWHLGIMAALTLLNLYFDNPSMIQVDGHAAFFPGNQVPLGALGMIGTFFAAIYASSAGTSLNRENQTRDLSWTKPISRTSLALQFVLVDIAAIAIVFVLAMVAVAIVLLRMNMVPAIEQGFATELAVFFGASVMWYALLQVLSFWFGSGARSLGGILWPIAFVVLALTHVPGPLGGMAQVIDAINPLRYLPGISDAKGAQAMSMDTRALCVWFFSVLFCAIAVTLWPRKEA